ncbi:MAG: putative Ig domain-containing protein [Candidatus Aenigmatarchaeota archaeon]
MNDKIQKYLMSLIIFSIMTGVTLFFFGQAAAQIRSVEPIDLTDSFLMLNGDSSNVKTVVTGEGSILEIDFAKGIVNLDGVETPIVVDELQYPEGQPLEKTKEKPLKNIIKTPVEINSPESTFVHKPYFDDQGNVSLDIYIESVFYSNNQATLDAFWDNFVPRYEILKNITGWSSKGWFGVPLEIYNYGHPAACYGGNASPTHSNVVFSDPMYKTGCNKPYYVNGTTYYNNTGELGDWWPYMNTALHEASHSINPYPIYTRSWLTEGFAEHHMYNVNAISGAINQETADTYLENGFSGYQWAAYVANDYHDTTIYDRELQRSHGYDITGHLLSKLEYEEGMDRERFYKILNDNKDTLDRTFSLGPPYIYYTDAFVINIFGRAMGHTDYLTQTDPMWNYYSGGGVDGHGFGARNISNSNQTPTMPYSDFDWFGDLIPTINISNENPIDGEEITITVTINNIGGVNMKNISTKIYDNDELLVEDFQNINKYNLKQFVLLHIVSGIGDHLIEARVDEDLVKIEMNNSNNNDSQLITAIIGPTPPVLDTIANQEVYETYSVVIQLNATDANEDDLSFEIDEGLPSPYSFDPQTGLFNWTPTFNDSGVYNVTFRVTDTTELYDEQEVTITVNNIVCGDLDYDGFLTALDLAKLIDILFAGEPLPDPPWLADLDGDGFPTALDLAIMIDHLFAGDPAPTCRR